MRPTTVERTDEPTLYRAPDGSITISIPMKIRKYSGRSQVILPMTISHTDFKKKEELTILQTALVRARCWQKKLGTGKVFVLAQRKQVAKAGQVHGHLGCRSLQRRLLMW